MEGFFHEVFDSMKAVFGYGEPGSLPDGTNVMLLLKKIWNERSNKEHIFQVEDPEDMENTKIEIQYNPELLQDLKQVQNLRLKVYQQAFGVKPAEVVVSEFVYMPKSGSVVVRTSLFNTVKKEYSSNMRVDTLETLFLSDKTKLPDKPENKNIPFTSLEARNLTERAYAIGYNLLTQKKLPPEFHRSFPVQSVREK